jgi:hypothetical protein
MHSSSDHDPVRRFLLGIAAMSAAAAGLSVLDSLQMHGGETTRTEPRQRDPLKEPATMKHTHTSAPTRHVEAKSVRFAYRQFGQTGGVPLLLMQHFRGGMDHWDPAVTDGFAHNRPVILFDNAGVVGSSG